MLGKRIINTATGAGAACTTDTVQILDGSPFQSIATYQLDGDATNLVDTGYIGNAAEFNGSTSVVTGSTNWVSGNNARAISLWISTTVSNNAGVFGYGNGASNEWFGLFLGEGNNYNRVGIVGYYNNIQSTYTLPSNGSWVHLVASFDGTTLKLYADNVEIYSEPESYNTTGTGGFTIGGVPWNTSGERFDGKIDQIRVFNKALSSSEVTTLYGETSASSTKSTTDIFADSSGISLYEFEGNANDTGGTYNGTATNVVFGYDGTASNVTYSTGKFGQAAVFNGSSSNIVLGNVFNSVLSNDFTISTWVNVDSMGGQIFGKGIWVANGEYVRLYTRTSTPRIQFGFEDGGSNNVSMSTNSTNLEGTGWRHIVAIGDYTNGKYKLYLDGALIEEQNISGSLNMTNAEAARIGNRESNNAPFNGSIDQVRIFDRAISAADVTTLYNETVATASTNPTFNAPSLVAYYKMNDATDETGSYDGTPTDVNFNVAGKFGNAGEFNGSSSYISASIPFLNARVTSAVSLWIKYTDTGAYRSVFNDYSNTANFNHNIIVNQPSTGNLRFFSAYGGNTGYKIIESSGLTLNDGNWHHIVSTVDLSTNTLTGYVDGVSVGNVTVSTNAWTGTTQNLQIGRQEAGAYFNGSIDQIRIFDRAITANEVTTLYNEVYCQPTIVPTDHFETVLYTGAGATNTITGVGFQPDLVWIKDRDAALNHLLADTVRGISTDSSNTTGLLLSNLTNAELTNRSEIRNLSTDGFDVTGTGSGSNTTGHNFVAWNWKAGGTAVSNSDGTITSQVSANTDAGFSIVKFTGNSTNGATIGHGLAQEPDFIIVKGTQSASAYNWMVYASAATTTVGNTGENGHAYLNLTNPYEEPTNQAVKSVWDDTAPTSSVFTVSNNANVNANGNYIAYCFHSVDGMSKFGSYVGTGASGNSIVTGFKPAFVMVKNTTSGSSDDWHIFDNKRDDENPNSYRLKANTSDSENPNDTGFNFLSNGFEVLGASGARNENNNTYIFMAFAEEVFVPDNFFNDDSTLATYKLNGDAGDDSGNGYNGTASNVTYATGKFDDAAVFNGSSSYINYDNFTFPTNDFTFSAWANTNNVASQYNMITTIAKSGSGRIYLTFEYNKLFYYDFGSTVSLASSVGSISNNTWYHCLITKSSTDGIKLYLNGNLVDSNAATTSNPTNGTGQNRIGHYYTPTSIGYFNGKIDQVRIFDRALTAGEVTQLYNE
jgi:hypothetical protein